MNRFAALCLTLTCVAPAAALEDGTCNSWAGATNLGNIQLTGLDEISGVAASHRFDDVLWAHNDSGGGAAVFAIGTDGTNYGAYTLLGADNEDWEDIAVGPCPDGEDPCSCIHVGDFGSNDNLREVGVVYRAEEPEFDTASGGGQIAGVEELWFRYPDGPHDAEALAVHPFTGEVLVITKVPDGEILTGIFAFPEVPPVAAPANEPVTLDEVAWIDVEGLGADKPKVTAADVSPRGSRLVLRTNGDALLFDVPAGGALRDAFDSTPKSVPTPSAEDGEALAFSPDGREIYMISEGQTPAVWRTRCLLFDGDGEDDWDPLVDCEKSPGDCDCDAGGGAAGALLLPLLLAAAVRRLRP